MSMTSTSDYGSDRTLSAMFDSRAEADRAVEALRAAGIADVVLTGGEASGGGADTTRSDTARTEDRGFFEALGDFFFPDEDRYVYAEGLNRGGYLVTVSNIPAHQYETALDILDDEGAVDLDARETEWRSEGWSYDSRTESRTEGGMMPGESALTSRDEGLPGTMASRAADRVGDALSGDRTYSEDDLNRDGTIDIVEERMSIAKREADLGRVRVRSYVREIPVEESVNLREERVSIERRPVDRAATDADFRDQTIEAREYAEEAVVNKEARVVEEVALRKDVESREEVVRDTLRKTEVEIEDDRGSDLGGGRAGEHRTSGDTVTGSGTGSGMSGTSGSMGGGSGAYGTTGGMGGSGSGTSSSSADFGNDLGSGRGPGGGIGGGSGTDMGTGTGDLGGTSPGTDTGHGLGSGGVGSGGQGSGTSGTGGTTTDRGGLGDVKRDHDR